jgi:hypothetical protein
MLIGTPNSSWSASGWINKNNNTGVLAFSDYNSVAGNTNPGENDITLAIHLQVWENQAYVSMRSNNLEFGTQGGVISSDQWHHIAFTAGNDVMTLFVDGVNVSSIPYNSSISYLEAPLYRIGSSMWNGNYGPSSGLIDDISIHNRALTQEEITALYTGEPVSPPAACTPLPSNLQQGLVGYWPFCGNANDESGNGNDGTVNGATLTEDRFGNAGSAFEFSEAEQNSIDVGNNPNFNFESNSNFTISLWTKNNSVLSINSYAIGYYMYKGNGGGDNKKWLFGDFASPYSNGNFAYVFHSNDELGNSNWLGDSITHEPDLIDWNHIVISKEDSIFHLFKNGQLINNETIDNYPNYYNDSNLFFGRGENVTMNAKLDDIGIWTRALTPEEVQELYTLDACTFTVYDTLTVYETVYDTVYTYETTYDTVTTYVTVTDTLLIDITFTGFEGQPSWLNTVTVFPNPASDQITIDYGNFALLAGYNTIITDAAGATVSSSAVNSQQAYIDINAWGATGVYYMTIYDASGAAVAVRHIVLE